MLLDPVALAWASWTGLAVGVMGTMVSLVGLVLTFREARRARTAADLAREQAARAVQLLRSRARLASLASAVSRTDLLMERIQRDGLASSPETLTEFRRLLREALAGGPQPARATREMDAKLEQLSRLASSRVEPRTKYKRMASILESVRTQLIAFEADARTEIDP